MWVFRRIENRDTKISAEVLTDYYYIRTLLQLNHIVNKDAVLQAF